MEPKGSQFQQLHLFMTGTQLRNSLTDSIDRGPGQSMEGMWSQKLRESKKTDMSHGAGTYQSIKKHGWKEGEPGPGLMHVREFSVVPDWDKDKLSSDSAHHRIAAAADIEAKSGGKREIYIPTTDRYEYPSIKPKDRIE